MEQDRPCTDNIKSCDKYFDDESDPGTEVFYSKEELQELFG